MKLSPEQIKGKNAVMQWSKTKAKRFTLSGPAGTGKTTLSKDISDEFETVVHCALTGKAASVLRKKGNKNASTIHGACYAIEDPKAEVPRFVLDTNSIMTTADLVIIDEGFMLDDEMIADIESLAKKVLYLGDPFQLPPIHGKCPLETDFLLTEIHRQALDSPILRAATAIREGRKLDYCDEGAFKYGNKSAFYKEDYETADQIIVGRNETRIAWNNRFRRNLGFEGQRFPCKGEKLICIKNSRETGLMNGMIDDCTRDARKVSFEEISLGFGRRESVAAWDGTFLGRKECIGKNKRLDRFDYGYAITCHKSQGSEFDDVLIYNEPVGRTPEDRRRWLYTGITRGKENVKVVQP